MLTLVGHFFMALGIVGIFIPFLPTAPFILLAWVCYAKGSPRFQKWILSNRYSGPLIKNWIESRSIPLKAKLIATVMLSASLVGSMIFVDLVAIKILTLVICISAGWFILSRPTSTT